MTVKAEGRFQWPDYLVFALSLLISAAIGIYYAFQSRKKQNTSEYLMGGRDMSILPVSTSLVVSLVSAIAVLGVPAETYAYGIQIIVFNLGYAAAMVLACLFYMPIYHRLKLTSMYEYLEMRFDYRVRRLCSVIGLIQMLLYSSVALYAPSIAISQVTGMPYWACILLSAILCTFYTTMGGFKTVLWTDTVQAAIMFLGLIATLAKGVVDVGGWQHVMNISDIGGRLDIGDIRPNIFTRHNVWGVFYGDLPFALALYATGQFAVQRFCSVRSLNKARVSLLGCIPILSSFSILSMMSGFVAFAYYWGCDPLFAKKIETRDQTLPVLVMDVFQNNPGMSGLFLSSVLSAALSTLSSVQNSFAAVFYEDGLKPLKLKLTGRTFTEIQGTIISKAIVFIIGAVILGLALGVANMGQLLFQMSSTALAISAGPSLGVFSLGMFIPFGNTWGALAGLVSGILILLWIAIGALTVEVLHRPLPTYNHLCNTTLTIASSVMAESVMNFNNTGISTNNTNVWQDARYSVMLHNKTSIDQPELTAPGLGLYRLSFRYYTGTGAIVSFIVGFIISLLTGGWKTRHSVPEETLFSWSHHGVKCEWESKVEEQDQDKKEFELTPVVVTSNNIDSPVFKKRISENNVQNDMDEKEKLMTKNT